MTLILSRTPPPRALPSEPSHPHAGVSPSRLPLLSQIPLKPTVRFTAFYPIAGRSLEQSEHGPAGRFHRDQGEEGEPARRHAPWRGKWESTEPGSKRDRKKWLDRGDARVLRGGAALSYVGKRDRPTTTPVQPAKARGRPASAPGNARSRGLRSDRLQAPGQHLETGILSAFNALPQTFHPRRPRPAYSE